MRKIIGVMIAVSLIISACAVKRNAIGDPDTLVVIADSLDWQRTSPLIHAVFARVVHTPQPEPWYNVLHVTPSQAAEYLDYKNILLVSLLREGSSSKKFIGQIFASTLVKNMESGMQTVALKKDPWRSQQLFMILTAPDFSQYQKIVRERGEELRGHFDQMFAERQMEYLYKRYEQQKMERRFQETYGWLLRIPRDYIIIHERPDSNFVWLGRHLPIRWVSVYWEETDTPVEMDSSRAVSLRRTVGQKHYGDVRTENRFLQTSRVRLTNGQPAIRVRGIWAHQTTPKGGVFTGLAFYNSGLQRIYYLDAQIFAPDLKKLVYLRRLELVLNTFRSGEERGED